MKHNLHTLNQALILYLHLYASLSPGLSLKTHEGRLLVSEVPKAWVLDGDNLSGHVFLQTLNCQLHWLAQCMELSDIRLHENFSKKQERKALLVTCSGFTSELKLSSVIFGRFIFSIL